MILKAISSTDDLPPDAIQSDPLRRLVNYWRALASNKQAPLSVQEGQALFVCADELTALLNQQQRKDAEPAKHPLYGVAAYEAVTTALRDFPEIPKDIRYRMGQAAEAAVNLLGNEVEEN